MKVMSQAFQITFEPSGRQFEVKEGEAILSEGIRQGVGMPYGCKSGVCGTCKCKLLSGQVTLGPHQEKALSAIEKAAGFVLTCQGFAQSDLVLESLQVSAIGGHAVRKMPARVLRLEKKSHDVLVLRLQLPANDAFNYFAGQYIEFILKDNVRRRYSMANAPGQLVNDDGTTANVVEFHIRHVPGGLFTDHVFSAMKEKDILRVEGPFGSFYLRGDSIKPIILLASGTGFAPLKALIEQMQTLGITRPATLYWGGRRPSDLYLSDWVHQKLSEMPSLKYVPVVSDSLPEDGWIGRTGFVHAAVLQDFPDLSGHQVYACGAPVVVDSARAEYVSYGKLDPNEFYSDAFVTEADLAMSI